MTADSATITCVVSFANPWQTQRRTPPCWPSQATPAKSGDNANLDAVLTTDLSQGLNVNASACIEAPKATEWQYLLSPVPCNRWQSLTLDNAWTLLLGDFFKSGVTAACGLAAICQAGSLAVIAGFAVCRRSDKHQSPDARCWLDRQITDSN